MGWINLEARSAVALASPAVAAQGVVVRYPGNSRRPALADVDLTVGEGERLFLLGANGAGKTTLLRVLAGLVRPSEGAAAVFGLKPARARAMLGVVSHPSYLYHELTATENLRLYGDLYGISRPEERAADVLGCLGLAGLAHERAGQLSRGQQQRLALARAVLHDPPILLLDEPDTGLDASGLAACRQVLLAAGRTVVFTTHNVDLGVNWATRAVMLDEGRLVHEQDDLAGPSASLLAALRSGPGLAPTGP